MGQSASGPASLDAAKDSRCEGSLKGLEALLDHRVAADIEYLSAARLNHQTAPVDKPVPQGLDGLKRPNRLSSAIRRAPLRGSGPHGRIRLEAMILNTCQALLA